MSEEFQDTFLQDGEVQEEVPEDVNQTYEEEMDEQDDHEQVDLDLSNNSYSYFDRHTDSIFLIASHPTLPMVLTGGGDEKAYLWTTHSTPAKLVADLSGQKESVIAGGFTADGKFAVTGDMSGQLRVWKAKAGGEKWEFHTSVQEVDEIVYIKFHPELPVVAVGSQDGSVWVYELGPKFHQVAVLNGHAGPATNAFFTNPEDLTLLTLSEDAQIMCWNTYQSQTIYTLGRRDFKGEHPWVSITPSPSGKTVAVGAIDGTLAIIKVDDGSVLHVVATVDDKVDLEGRSLEGLSWSDKTGLLATGNVNGLVQLFSPANWKVRVSFTTEESVTKLEFVKGEPFLVVSSMDEQIGVYDALSGQQVWKSQGHSAGVLGFVQQDGGKRIVGVDDAGIALVYQIDEQAENVANHVNAILPPPVASN